MTENKEEEQKTEKWSRILILTPKLMLMEDIKAETVSFTPGCRC